MRKQTFLAALGLILVLLLFVQCASSPRSTITVNAKEIQDYVCVVNRSLPPNLERFIKSLQGELIGEKDAFVAVFGGYTRIAAYLESARRGGHGSGFVYVDKKGKNYIVTNYHVIVGADRLSVTFENEKGEGPKFLNLSVVNADEQADLALLAFSDGENPFKKGLPINLAPIKAAAKVYAAGYGGMDAGAMGSVPKWGLSEGSVINAHITPPGEEYWYIQHGAAINPGNSGGPLLVTDRSSRVGFSVVGINTFYIPDRQGSNFSIPNEMLNSFLEQSFAKVDKKTILDKRVEAFMALLAKSANNTIYEDLSLFLSNAMLARDTILAISALPQNSIGNIIESKILEEPFIGIGWTVALTQIENSGYKRGRNVQTELVSIALNNFGGYTTKLLINGLPYKADWVWEYGTWKIDDFTDDDGEFNDVPGFATPHPLEKKIIYTFGSIIDTDWYVLDIPAAGRLTVWTEGRLDTELVLYYDPTTEESQKRTLIGYDDDSGAGGNAKVSENVRAGKVYVQVSGSTGFSSAGEYILVAELK